MSVEVEGAGGRWSSSVRERRRAETLAEIKAAALAQLADSGATKLSLREVARQVGMTVQSLYHYVDSYDALVTMLILDTHAELAAAVERAVATSVGASQGDRLVAVTLAYREWALQHRAQFLLIYGTPIPGYHAPETTLPEAWRQAAAFVDVVYDGWSQDELARIPAVGLSTRDAAAFGRRAQTASDPGQPTALGLPPGALRLLHQLRAGMHGLVMLELLGHLGPLPGDPAALMRQEAMRSADHLTRLRASVARP